MKTITKKDLQTEFNLSGIITVSTIIGGQRIKRLYSGINGIEAKQMFLSAINEQIKNKNKLIN
jgi:hypothetical protein